MANGKCLQIVKNLGDTVGAREGAVDSVRKRNSVPLRTSRGLSLGAKGRLYSACVHNIKLYGGKAWPIAEKFLITLERME